MKYIQYALLQFLSFTSAAQTGNDIEKSKWHYGTVQQDTTYGYAGVVKVGNTLYLSGVTSGGDFATQVSNIYRGLEKNLQKFGASFQNVVKENLYTLDIDSMKHYNYLRKPFYKGDFPAATWVQVSRLFSPDRMLEVELVAVLPDANPVGAIQKFPGNLFIGKWLSQRKSGMLFEKWTSAGDQLLKGASFFIKGNDTIPQEEMELKQTADGITFTSIVPGQNNELPVTFKMTSATGNRYVFENPQHDFPRRIVYEFTTTGQLHAWIDEGGPDPKKRVDFHFKRIK
jgi:2-iminobutanoate/2-iminopropanoate deaminase